MHELSIAEEIISIIKNNVELEEQCSVISVTIKIGKLQNILPDSLEFCFNALIQDSLLTKAKMNIIRLPMKYRCRTCSAENEEENYFFSCRTCSSSDISLIQGSELLVSEIELEEKEGTS